MAWQATDPPERKPLPESNLAISEFLNANDGWVIEGCYADLLTLVQPHSSEAVFMNLPVALCIENARKRPWEPHKYESEQAQNKNLDMLVGWISQYPERNDTCSEAAHKQLYEQYPYKKTMLTLNQ